ncbi:MAG: TraR/DksA C4-type zinc finger protein [candidate division WOR-3 bacterium]
MSWKIDYEYFERKLRKERKEVIEEIKALEAKVEINPLEDGEENTPFPTHIADIADVESRIDRDSYIMSQLTQKLKDIDIALQKIADKEYGFCENCGIQIKKERLKAIPYTRYCKTCAENKERISWKEEEIL